MYTDAAKIAENCTKGLGLKYQLYNSKYLKDRKNIASVSFLVKNTLQKKEEIDSLIEKSGLLQQITANDLWIARILVVEIVFGRKSFNAKDKISKKVYRFKKLLRELGSKMKVDPVKEIPRYVRVNLLKTTIGLATDEVKNLGYKLLDKPEELAEFYVRIRNMNAKEFMMDYHIPGLFVFHHKAKLHDTDLVTSGKVVLMDKSSCMVAPLVAPHPGSTSLDMCAAPGFKTAHLAAYLQNVGTIISVDKSKERFTELVKTKTLLGLNNVICLNQDSLNGNLPIDITEVSYIVLDPPCSGSGIVKNYDYEDNPNKDPKRLQGLHNLQCKMLKHALHDFPNVRRVLYSTCSLSEEENEAVIDEFINSPNGFNLVDLSSFYKGVGRGKTDYASGAFCIRMHPSTELTNGFFIAMFERSNPHLFDNLPEKKRKLDNLCENKLSKTSPTANQKDVKRKNINKNLKRATTNGKNIMITNNEAENSSSSDESSNLDSS